MRKKAFTLIELIAVVVLLGVIGLITYPTVTGVINDSKEKAYNTQISMLEEAGKRWGIDNTNQLNENKNVLLQIDDLIKDGYITKTKNGELVDPRTNEKLEGCIIVSYSNSYKQYEYKYDTECIEPVDTTPPNIAMSVADGTLNSDGWATNEFYVNINGAHLTSYKYCVSNVECEPDTVVTGNSGSIYIQTIGVNYVCIKGFNTVGSTETICNQYGLSEPTYEVTFTTSQLNNWSITNVDNNSETYEWSASTDATYKLSLINGTYNYSFYNSEIGCSSTYTITVNNGNVSQSVSCSRGSGHSGGDGKQQ